MKISETLEKIGLSEGEVGIYLALLKRGRMKPSELAKQTGISRPMVYNLAKNLLSKGIISEDISGKVLHFLPLPPANLERLIKPIKDESLEKEKLIRKAIGDLSLIGAEKQYPVPKIRFVEEHDLKKFLYDNLTKWQDEVIASDGVWRGFQDSDFVEKFDNWIATTWQTKQSKDLNYKAEIFTNTSRTEQALEKKHPKSKRDMHFLNQSDFTATTWVCGDYLIMIAIQARPYYLIEIHDKLMARNTAEIFKRLWEKKD